VKTIELLCTSTTTSQTKPKQKFISHVFAMWPTHASENIFLKIWTSTITLQTKPKQKFASSVLSPWLIHVSDKNKTTFEPSQPPCDINQ